MVVDGAKFPDTRFYRKITMPRSVYNDALRQQSGVPVRLGTMDLTNNIAKTRTLDHRVLWWYRDLFFRADDSVDEIRASLDTMLRKLTPDQLRTGAAMSPLERRVRSRNGEAHLGGISPLIVNRIADLIVRGESSADSTVGHTDPGVEFLLMTGKDLVAALTKSAYIEIEEAHLSGAALVGPATWWIGDEVVFAPDDYTSEMVELEVWDQRRRKDAKFERLRKIRARDEDLTTARREAIPPEVRAFVWERDEGKCVRCGAEDDLQFDHVIPVAKGGGNEIGNVQILCGDCNRLKSDSIV